MSKLDNLKKDLKKANERLKEVLEMEQTQVNQDATIQRFEFCFELSWKVMKEFLRDQGIMCNSPKSCIREAGSYGAIDNVEKWLVFLESRNSVAHMYNEEMASSVFKEATKLPEFVDEFLKEIE